jgi:hypothetical protein
MFQDWSLGPRNLLVLTELLYATLAVPSALRVLASRDVLISTPRNT